MAVVKLLRSTTPGHVPPSLVSGQIAINEADGILFYLGADGLTVESFPLRTLVSTTEGSNDNSTKVATTAFVQGQVAALIGSAGTGLNTLEGLANAINNDANFYADMMGMIVNRLRFDQAQTLSPTQIAQVQANIALAAALSPYALASALAALAPINSPTFTGVPAAPTASGGDNSTKLATTAFVTAALASSQALAAATVPIGGFVNRFRNGCFGVWQRGLSGTAYLASGPLTQTGPDGWYIVPAGANVTWSNVGAVGQSAGSLRVTGATGCTDVIVKQRLESHFSAALQGETITVQCFFYNGTSASITPKLTVKHATVQDNWAASATDQNADNMSPVAPGAWTRIAYTWGDAGHANLGLEISIDVGALGAGAFVQFGEFDIRAPRMRLLELTPRRRWLSIGLSIPRSYLASVTSFRPTATASCLAAPPMPV